MSKQKILLLLSLFLMADAGLCQRFFPDDPIRVDPDNLPIEKPGFQPISPSADALENYFKPEGEAALSRAQNDNTLGEVPDSSWFTNRIGMSELSLMELKRGGLGENCLDTESELRIVGATLGGTVEVLIAKDRSERTFQLLFDRKEYPRLATAAQIISSKFLYAAGYNVLPTCLADIDRDQLVLSSNARVSLLGGKERPLNEEFVSFLLNQAYASREGKFRVAASLLPEGERIGGFKYFGTRPDDSNDIFPHQDRRELRGLKIFASWLNHYNVDSVNTLDLYVPHDTGGYVKHFLIDFSTSLGSGLDEQGRISPKDPRAGNEYTFLGNVDLSLRTGLSLGIWQRPWLKIDYPLEKYPEVGRIESDYFRPEKWQPNYPNVAFRRMLPEDAFWAVLILNRFSDEAIRAIVEEARLSDLKATEYLSQVLIERRDKNIRHYLKEINPLYAFRLEADALYFRNLGEEQGLGSVKSYEFQWYDFDNGKGIVSIRDEDKGQTSKAQIPLPEKNGKFSMVRVRSLGSEFEEWRRDVRIYLRWEETPEVVGVEREMSVYVVEELPTLALPTDPE